MFDEQWRSISFWKYDDWNVENEVSYNLCSEKY